MSTLSNNSTDSQISAQDSMSFEKEPRKCQTPSRSTSNKSTMIDNTTTIQDDECDTFFSSIDLIVTSCMSHEDDGEGDHVRHDDYSSPITPKKVNNHETQVESRSNEFQRRGRFLIWPASFGLDATIASTP